MKPTPQQVQERFESLPEDMRAAITSEEVSDNLKNLGGKYKLRIDKVSDLIDEVGMVMLGFKKSSSFIDNLSRRLEIDRETAESLAVDIDRQVFKKVRDSLRTVQFSEHKKEGVEPAHAEYGDSPVRDSLLQDIERHGGTDAPILEDEDGFIGTQPDVQVPIQEVPTPYEQHEQDQETPVDPSKTFKDHLEKKIDAVKDEVNVDPYRESI